MGWARKGHASIGRVQTPRKYQVLSPLVSKVFILTHQDKTRVSVILHIWYMYSKGKILLPNKFTKH